MANWIRINTTTGRSTIVNLDRVSYIKWESGTLYFYDEIDGRPSAGKQIAFSDPDRTNYVKVINIIKERM